jgi:glutathione peroxidase
VKLIPALFAIVCLAAPALASGDKPMSFYDLTANTLDGTPKALSDYKGKVLLVVNTASKCGFTPQYEGLEHDFGGQEPGTPAEIKTFCEQKYHVTFPLFAKVKTKGEGQSPVYKFLTTGHGEPKWNFHKYVIGKDGQVRAEFPSAIKPDSPELQTAIEAALKAS